MQISISLLMIARLRMGVFANRNSPGLARRRRHEHDRIKFKETRIMEMLVVCRHSRYSARCISSATFHRRSSESGSFGESHRVPDRSTDIDSNDRISIVKNSRAISPRWKKDRAILSSRGSRRWRDSSLSSLCPPDDFREAIAGHPASPPE